MSETTFEKRVLHKLESVEKTIHHILEHLEDSKLTSEERKLLQDSYAHEKEGKLFSSPVLKKKLGQ